MARLTKGVLALAILGILAAGGGFYRFAEGIRTQAPSPSPRADAIVALTGDEDRIMTAMRLLIEQRGSRLLVSGVHPATRMPTELKRRIAGSDRVRLQMIQCCVDIGREALNTSGNAAEAGQWAATHGFRSLIVVTSSYHMPRSLTEFRRIAPGLIIEPYPVATSRSLNYGRWWAHRPTLRLLVGEYVKYLGAVARQMAGAVLPIGQSRPATPPQPTAPAGVAETAGSLR
jgi:uncharacterized SAM-binding protein YcdF (DUF218 family)